MFTRPNLATMPPPELLKPGTVPTPTATSAPSKVAKSALAKPALGSEPPPKSVISNDLTIIGHQLRIISKSLLQVDGAIEGDVHGAEVLIGTLGRVSGTVVAENVVVEGQVVGTIRGVRVELRASARVEGEIHHQSLSIDRGAQFDGRVRRVADAKEILIEPLPDQEGPREEPVAA